MCSVWNWLQGTIQFIRNFYLSATKLGEKSEPRRPGRKNGLCSGDNVFKRELSHFFQTNNSCPQNWAQDKINSCDFPGKCHVCCEVSAFLLWDGSHLNTSRWIRASMFTCQATRASETETDGGRDRKTEKSNSLLGKADFSWRRLYYNIFKRDTISKPQSRSVEISWKIFICWLLLFSVTI